jgi:hypothetical protein
MDLHTNYRQDYVTPELPSKQTTPIKSKEILPEQTVRVRRPMNGISQTSFDFRPYSKKYRRPKLADMEPFLSQITIGNPFISAEKFVFDNPILH